MVLFFNEHHIGKNLWHDNRNKRYDDGAPRRGVCCKLVKACAWRGPLPKQ